MIIITMTLSSRSSSWHYHHDHHDIIITIIIMTLSWSFFQQAGFSTEDSPQCIIPTVVGRGRHKGAMEVKLDHHDNVDWYEIQDCTKAMEIKLKNWKSFWFLCAGTGTPGHLCWKLSSGRFGLFRERILHYFLAFSQSQRVTQTSL